MALNTVFIREVGPMRWVVRYSFRQFCKRVLRRDMSIRLPTGLRFPLPRNSQHATEVFVTGCDIDAGSEALFAKFASADSDFLDVGANIGYYSMYLSPLVRRVYAFEPDARNLEYLRENARAAMNVEVIAKAVAQHSGEIGLDVSAGTAISHLTEETGDGVVRVPAVSIDDFVRTLDHPRIGLIKTDVEGFDLAALAGASETVATHQPLILSEIIYDDALRAVLAQWGYSAYGFPHKRSALQRAGSMDRSKMLFLVPPRLRDAFDHCVSA